MKTNVVATRPRTHEGAPAHNISPEQQLRRSVMSCMLFESEAYEDGVLIAKRIAELVPKVPFETLASIAIEAREKMKLRHVPLLLARESLRHFNGRKVGDLIASVIQRPDEVTELLALYWKDDPADKRSPLAKQLRVGLARAIQKFDEYSLAKWNGGKGAISLRDVVFLTHPRPHDQVKGSLLARLVNKERIPAAIAEQHGIDPGTVGLASPETWENRLSRGEDKKTVFEDMLVSGQLQALALLRNLRNMIDAGVPDGVIRGGIIGMKTDRVLPYRFIAAAKYAPRFEPELEHAMFRCLEGAQKFDGRTVLLVDVSGSMDARISSKSELMRLDAACGLAMLARELCDDIRIITFSEVGAEIPPRRGFGLRDAIIGSQPHRGTALGAAIRTVNERFQFDRMIVITDEQSRDKVPDPKGRGYMINVASAQHGVGYGAWRRVDGWSEAVLDYIQATER